MNATRKQAQKEYDVALIKMRATEDGNDLQAWEAANAALAVARTSLIEAESKYPTQEEVRRASRKRWLRNIGLDA